MRYALFLTLVSLHYPRVSLEIIQPTLPASSRAVCSQTSYGNELATFLGIPHLPIRNSCPKTMWNELQRCYGSVKSRIAAVPCDGYM
jgi:hypothetical protein